MYNLDNPQRRNDFCEAAESYGQEQSDGREPPADTSWYEDVFIDNVVVSDEEEARSLFRHYFRVGWKAS